jgi:uncharacterized protein YqjF (DUF2071 family)
MNTNTILQKQAHRQTPLPRGAWVMHQSWRELLFAHWPIAVQTLRPLLPPALTLDTFEQEAWVGIVPFQMYDVCPRGVPALPWFSESPELNVRTYVTVQGVPGVYFFSLDAANPLFVSAARTLFSLPYFNARMRVEKQGDEMHYRSQRAHTGAPTATYEARYRPIGPVTYATPGSLPFWLTERYCLYTVDKRGQVFRVDIHHGPWPLQAAELETIDDTMARSHGILLPDTPPLLYYSHWQDTLAWLPRRVEIDTPELAADLQ